MFLCAYRSRINTYLKWITKKTSKSCPDTPAWHSIILRRRRQVFKNLNRHGNKTSRGALGCAKGVGFRIMARERMAKLLKIRSLWSHFMPHNDIFYDMSIFHVHKRTLKDSYVVSLAFRWRFGLHHGIRHIEMYWKKIVWAKLNVRISRTKPKRHGMQPICPLILLCQLAASWPRITLWA